MGVIEVVEPGVLTTVQDLGRHGYLRLGVPASGAMDLFALRAANILAGNPEGEACLEITVLGPRLQFLSDALIVLTGADLAPELDDDPVPMWEAVAAYRGSILSFQGPREGSRSYLAVAGGFDVPVVMGSKSTYVKAGLGGFKGRSLRAGDTLLTPLPTPPLHLAGRRTPRELIPHYGHQHALRVITGPQDDAFTDTGIEAFLSSSYTITAQSDRMGYRLEGPKIAHKVGPDIISDGIPFGGIQVAGDGQPIVLMADRGTSGGYTKIATVISADLSDLAQGMPGDRVSFKSVSIEQAHEALRQQEATLSRLKELLAAPIVSRQFRIRVEGDVYNVSVEMTGMSSTGDGPRASASGRVRLVSESGESRSYGVDVEAGDEVEGHGPGG